VRLEVGPAEIPVVPGTPASVVAQVFNTDDVINAYEIRVFGVDPAWVQLERERLSLFPSSAGVVTVLVTVPEDYPAGPLHLGIEVTPAVDAAARQLGNVTLVVPARKQATMHVDPQSVVAGRKATFNLTFTNEGNTPFELELDWLDPEAKVVSTFAVPDPPPKPPKGKKPAKPRVEIVPGEHVIVPVQTKARPPVMGAPAGRLVTFTANGADNPLETMVSFVQKPTLGRGLISLFGLLMAITIFALVLTTTLSRVVDVAKVDQALLKRAVEGEPAQRGIPDDAATIVGEITQLTSGNGVFGATVEVFSSDDPAAPVTSSVSDEAGSFTVANLDAGTYKIRFRGVGFNELWYEGASTFDEATEVDVELGQTIDGISAVIGSLPGSIEGVVVADDPTDALVKLQVPSEVLGSETDAVIQEVAVAADGAFVLAEIPAPASYELVVEKVGYTTASRIVNLAGGETQVGIEIRLRKGDGLISGIVTDEEGLPLGGVAIKATNMIEEVTTVTLTNGPDAGRFTLRNLPTPSTYTITFEKAGYATENVTVALGLNEQRPPDTITLAEGTGSIAGTVRQGEEGLGGVLVTVSNGEVTVTTETLSVGDVGTYILSNLPVPGTYTITFSGNGLAPQVRSVDLDPAGESNATGVDASLTAATAVVSGVVSNADGPLGGVAVELTDGTTTLTTNSADDPPGQYVLPGVPPGTYTLTFRLTGAVPSSVLLTLAAGEDRAVDVELKPQATIEGTVRRAGSGGAAAAPLAGAQVTAYRVAEFPGTVAATAVTADDGTYTLTDLAAPDEYVIEFAYPVGALAQSSVRITLDAGQQRTGVDAVITLPGDDE